VSLKINKRKMEINGKGEVKEKKMKKRKRKRKNIMLRYIYLYYKKKIERIENTYHPNFFIHPTSSLLDDLLSLELRV
jgi:hypothetical protein